MKLQLIHQKLKPPAAFPDGKGNCSPWNSGLQKIYRDAVLVLTVIVILILLMMVQLLLFPYNHQMDKIHIPSEIRKAAADIELGWSDSCSLVLVESIPEGMHFGPNSTVNPSIFEGWMKLLREAEKSIEISSFYWTMQNKDTNTSEPSAYQGEEVLQKLQEVSKNLSVRIAVSKPSRTQNLADLDLLKKSGAKFTVVDMPRLTTGVLHTKFWIVDRKHVYIGSANMDWRSLTQVKELGAIIFNCSQLAEDLGKTFEEYWNIGGSNSSIPSPWPSNYSTSYNEKNPMELELNNSLASVYFSSSPRALCPDGRTDDLTSILSIIDDAKKFVHVAVMNYIPVTVFSYPKRYWPDIDTRLRKAAFERKVKVRLLISCWSHSNPSMFPFLQSLAALKSRERLLNVEVRIFRVPATQKQSCIPYARVNHNKYMVTDRVAYIGTSNWSGDYFVNTAGVGLVVNQSSTMRHSTGSSVRKQLQDVFSRDWNSPFSKAVNNGEDLSQICKYI
ncbi:5'-3' exonuclease PLD3 isoform X1 [Stegostoma tigrinum]|uniref:5'-3' exonuclease PLD3 isoform X1 n=2 Tax=Stegostoma tigrinum TaxID=3053191 RepID=UPI00202B54D6|nr:5'-3' exonuclease PLD3 isoform X1 [Stegostoma tigrinum]XP_059497019.1 5'-3' exonuclease PLD3 isoform X1 [Stegostoma tigrinum]